MGAAADLFRAGKAAEALPRRSSGSGCSSSGPSAASASLDRSMPFRGRAAGLAARASGHARARVDRRLRQSSRGSAIDSGRPAMGCRGRSPARRVRSEVGVIPSALVAGLSGSRDDTALIRGQEGPGPAPRRVVRRALVDGCASLAAAALVMKGPAGGLQMPAIDRHVSTRYPNHVGNEL
jgi:hypothetical protein